MARPKGSKNRKTLEKEAQAAGNPAPAAAAEPAKASPKERGIGDNSGLSDEQRQSLTYHHRDAYVEALANKKKYDADFKNVCKKAVAELGDDAIDDIKDLILLATPEGEAKMKAEIERRRRIARWEGLPLGTQADLLDGVDRTPLIDKARADGKRAGLAGDRCEPPHSGHEASQAWIAGWHEGQDIKLATGIKPLEQPEPDFGQPQETQPSDLAPNVDPDPIPEFPDRRVQGAAAFRENVQAGDNHIKQVSAELAADREAREKAEAAG